MKNQSQLAVDEEGLVAFAQELIRTPSLSMEEEAVAKKISQRMEAIGLEAVHEDPIHNVGGYLKGNDPAVELMFNGHIDHVPPGDMAGPYSGEIVDGDRYGCEGPVMTGRGACDMKGAVAAMIYAAKAVRDSGIPLKKTFLMTAVSREEMAKGEGIRRLLEEEGVTARMAVSGEATDLQIHLGHRGKLEFTVTTHGRTAHASNPDRGVNAVYKMCDFIDDLRTGYELSSHPVLGPCTFAVIDILSRPGRLGPITPDSCEIALDRRYLPMESAESVRKEIEAMLERRAASDADFRWELELVKDFPPFFCEEDQPVVQLAKAARKAVLGEPGKISVWKFGVDGTFIHRAGIPCVGFGPGDERFAHTPEDHVPVDHLIRACRVYAEMICRACG
jgi:putative selenium metabolism hydrolase